MMFSPLRISLKILDSPIEPQTFRLRPLRKFIVASCCLFLFFVTLRSVNLQRRLSDGYLNLHNNEGTYGLLRSPPVEDGQHTFQTWSEEPGDRPATVEKQIRHLPEIVRIPFEQGVSDVVLQGWEDEWFSSAAFDFNRFGPLAEPKIDFVYNCKYRPNR